MAQATERKRVKKKECERPVCPKCGTVIKIGDWPWCPHSRLKSTRHLWNWVK